MRGGLRDGMRMTGIVPRGEYESLEDKGIPCGRKTAAEGLPFALDGICGRRPSGGIAR